MDTAQSNNSGGLPLPIRMPGNPGSDPQAYLLEQLLNGHINVATPVKVVSVTNDGDLSPVGYVDVQPLVNYQNHHGHTAPQGVIYHLPYFRIQGGGNAVIMDPEKGDIGVAIFADRDISTVKETGETSDPGSYRRYDMADGLYMGGFLNGLPVQYVRFSKAGINLVSPVKVTVDAPDVLLKGSIDIDGGLSVNGIVVGDQ